MATAEQVKKFEEATKSRLSELFQEVKESKDGYADFIAGDNSDFLGLTTLIIARPNRKNLVYYESNLVKARETYVRNGKKIPILAIALPRDEITPSVRRRCQETNIQLIEIDFSIKQEEEFVIKFNLNDPSDKNLLSWLKNRTSYERQVITKKALRREMDNEIQADTEDFQSLARYVRESMAAIQKMMQNKPEKGGDEDAQET